jgi:hypothetical protein
MTAPLTWPEFEHLPTRNRQEQHTGFGPGGNGYTLLRWLNERGVKAVRDRETDAILLITEVRDDARLEVGWWLIDDEGVPPELPPEVWPIKPAVHRGRYRAVSS